MNFLSRLDSRIETSNSLLSIGLDSDSKRLPKHLPKKDKIFNFNKHIIETTHELVCAYKINSAFYEAEGEDGIRQLKLTCDFLKKDCPDIPIILDFKRGDIGNSNNGYARFAFDYLNADAVTLNPYLGREALNPFLSYADKGIVILCKTSNSGSGEFQDIDTDGKKLYQLVAEKVTFEWNELRNCLLVVGATYPAELADLRRRLGEDMVFLVPGVGSQGGDIKATVEAGMNGPGKGLIINSSREVIFASESKDFAEAARQRARQTKEAINNVRSKK